MERKKWIKQIESEIKKLKRIGILLLVLTLIFLSYFNILAILNSWNKNNLSYVFLPLKELVNYTPKTTDLMVLYPIIVQYLLTIFMIVVIAKFFIKINYEDCGEAFFYGLFYGLIGGLMSGLIAGLIAVPIIPAIISGTIYALIISLIVGIFGFVIIKASITSKFYEEEEQNGN